MHTHPSQHDMFSSSAKSTSFFPFSPFFLPCFLIRISLIGEELDAFLQRHQPAFDRIIYIGDGSNDFCPILRLRRYVIHPCAHNPFILSLLSVNEQSEKNKIYSHRVHLPTTPPLAKTSSSVDATGVYKNASNARPREV